MLRAVKRHAEGRSASRQASFVELGLRRTGNSVVTYCPGGKRPFVASSRCFGVKPRERGESLSMGPFLPFQSSPDRAAMQRA